MCRIWPSTGMWYIKNWLVHNRMKHPPIPIYCLKFWREAGYEIDQSSLRRIFVNHSAEMSLRKLRELCRTGCWQIPGERLFVCVFLVHGRSKKKEGSNLRAKDEKKPQGNWILKCKHCLLLLRSITQIQQRLNPSSEKLFSKLMLGKINIRLTFICFKTFL